MYNLLMFAFANQEMAMRVVPSSNMEFLIYFVLFCNAISISWIIYLLKDIRVGLKATVQGLDTVSNNHRMMFKRMGDQLEEAKETKEILSKLVVKKKTNPTDNH